MRTKDLVNKVMKMKNVGLQLYGGTATHGKKKGMKLVNEFVNVAKELLASFGNYTTRNTGIITFGDGDACEKMEDCSGFGTFFDRNLMHYQAFLESMQSNFAKHLAQARMAMECHFVGPNISCHAWFQKWKKINETCHFQAGTTLEGSRVSTERLMEAKEIVRERENSYEMSIAGNSENELTLEWRGITLVRVSAWIN